MSRERVVSVRLTDAEHERLRQRAGRRRLSDVIRDALAPSATLSSLGPSVTCPSVLPVTCDSVTVPAPANIIWLTGGHSDGHTLTLSAA